MYASAIWPSPSAVSAKNAASHAEATIRIAYSSTKPEAGLPVLYPK